MTEQSSNFKNDLEVQQHVLRLFGYRCIGIDKTCGRYTTTVHEILPRSRGKIAYEPNNRIPLCLSCHETVHRLGVSDEMILKLQNRRAEYLLSIGKSDAT